MAIRSGVVASIAVFSLVFGLAGCGSDDDSDSSATTPPIGQAPTTATTAKPDTSDKGDTGDTGDKAEGGEVDVVAKDIKFDKDKYSTDAGSVKFEYKNEGVLEHTLLIEDVDGFKLDLPTKGDSDEGTVELEPGTYTIYCDISGHREAGMHAELKVG